MEKSFVKNPLHRNYDFRGFKRSKLVSVEKFEGEPIEWKVRRIEKNKEPIKDGAPEIFTEKKDGVMAAYNIRTDRFEIAADAMDSIHRSEIGSRNSPGMKKVEDSNESDGEGAQERAS